MLKSLAAAILCLAVLAGAAESRLPPEDFAPQRLDGPGPRAFAKFRAPDPRCGILRDSSDGTKIYNTFEGAILKLDFHGEARRVLPLMMTDKPGDDQVLKVKLRTPCLLGIARAGADYLLHVTTRRQPPGAEATLRVNAEGQLLNPEANGNIFYVVGENSRGQRNVDRFALIASRLGRFTCLPREADAACEYQFLAYAERLFADEIRHQSALPDAGRRAAHVLVDRAVAAAIADPVLLALHRLIVANESATISPFQIWDAVLADSGLSFGPHQWDIGINPEGQRIFAALAGMAGLAAPERYFRSLWRFSAGDFHDYLLWRTRIDRALQSPEGQKLVIDGYLRWLARDALSNARAALSFLDPGRKTHRVMLLYYADADNQYGDESLKSDLRAIIARLAQEDAALAEIRAALDARMLATPFARNYPDKAAARLARSWEILGSL